MWVRSVHDTSDHPLLVCQTSRKSRLTHSGRGSSSCCTCTLMVFIYVPFNFILRLCQTIPSMPSSFLLLASSFHVAANMAMSPLLWTVAAGDDGWRDQGHAPARAAPWHGRRGCWRLHHAPQSVSQALRPGRPRALRPWRRLAGIRAELQTPASRA
jgi:hypothetical protein